MAKRITFPRRKKKKLASKKHGSVTSSGNTECATTSPTGGSSGKKRRRRRRTKKSKNNITSDTGPRSPKPQEVPKKSCVVPDVVTSQEATCTSNWVHVPVSRTRTREKIENLGAKKAKNKYETQDETNTEDRNHQFQLRNTRLSVDEPTSSAGLRSKRPPTNVHAPAHRLFMY
ncbi:hypothetical protein K1T71_013584 [Dendrolimus kikuchii]|uniref:Uncharacterized protein n=1 Tax=Dendrolimus kikuchii TaxID=765133 RepID=A0ACC1CH78_9NEOP|nr:hypothetical protein K1T71_013584 [Dendrolimus kikuchii]